MISSKKFNHFLILLIIFTLTSTIGITLADVRHHENPDEVESFFEPVQLIIYYKQILESIKEESYENCTFYVDLLRLASVPEQITRDINRLNNLLKITVSDLNESNVLILKAKKLGELGAFNESLNMIEIARKKLNEAISTFSEFKSYFNSFSGELSRLGPSGPFYSSEVREVGALISEIEGLMKKKLDEIEILPKKLKEKSEIYVSKAIPTRISLIVYPGKVMVGENVSIKGLLETVDGIPIPNRSIKITFMGEVVDLTYTNNSGFFEVNLTVPFIYLRQVEIGAYFMPQGNDIGLYAPSNNVTLIQLVYYNTNVKLSIESRLVYLGLKFRVGLYVEPIPENTSRNVELYIDNFIVGRIKINKSETTLNLVISPDVGVGAHVITAIVKPFKVFGPGKDKVIIVATYKKASFKVDIPTVIFYPISDLTITGSILGEENQPLTNETIEVEFMGKTFKVNSRNDGSFELSLSSPRTFFSRDFLVIVKFIPRESWYPVIVKNLKVTVINIYFLISLPFIVGFTFFSSLRVYPFIGEFLKRSGFILPKRGRISKEFKGLVERKLTRAYTPTIKGRVTEIYWETVKLFDGTLRPEETLREFYNRVASKFEGKIGEAFHLLTLAAEYEIYSGKTFPEEDYETVLKAYELIRDELKV